MTQTIDDATFTRIASLLGASTTLLDTHRWDEWAGLFTPDGTFELPDRSFAGRSELRAFAERSTPGVHLTGLPLIERTDAGLIARSPFFFVAAADGRMLSGRYTDTIALAGEDARFACRRVEIVRVTPGSAP